MISRRPSGTEPSHSLCEANTGVPWAIQDTLTPTNIRARLFKDSHLALGHHRVYVFQLLELLRLNNPFLSSFEITPNSALSTLNDHPMHAYGIWVGTRRYGVDDVFNKTWESVINFIDIENTHAAYPHLPVFNLLEGCLLT